MKVGPDLLKYIPGEKVSDLRYWLEAYRYWNQGGLRNFQSMLNVIQYQYNKSNDEGKIGESNVKANGSTASSKLELPQLQVTPDIGLVHPLLYDPRLNDEHRRGQHSSSRFAVPQFFESPASYLQWRLSDDTVQNLSKQHPATTTSSNRKHHGITLADPQTAPRVAILLYRKHVITEQRYIWDLIEYMEAQNTIPVPIFINGVEAHTIVRDVLTSQYEINGVQDGTIHRDATYDSKNAVRVDAIVNTVGFPLVGTYALQVF